MLAYLSQISDKKIIDALKHAGFQVKLLSPFSALSTPTDTHTDMLLLAVGDTIFVHKDYPGEILGFDNIIKIDEPIGAHYPNDVLLNIAIVGRHAFANTKHASKTILKYLEDNGYSIHHVAQGYAHCSTLIVSENAIITADEGITEAAREVGIAVLKISAGHISLLPYDYGFIGGASGTTDDAVYFCGSLSYHPEGEQIRVFIESHGKAVRELGELPLSDIGGFLFK